MSVRTTRSVTGLLVFVVMIVAAAGMAKRVRHEQTSMPDDPVQAMRKLAGRRVPVLPWKDLDLDRLGRRCTNGYADACTTLGQRYDGLVGEFFDFDLPPCLGHALFERSCGHGDATACFHLGEHARLGTCGPRDRARAAALYDEACGGGLEWACEYLDRFAG